MKAGSGMFQPLLFSARAPERGTKSGTIEALRTLLTRIAAPTGPGATIPSL